MGNRMVTSVFAHSVGVISYLTKLLAASGTTLYGDNVMVFGGTVDDSNTLSNLGAQAQGGARSRPRVGGRRQHERCSLSSARACGARRQKLVSGVRACAVLRLLGRSACSACCRAVVLSCAVVCCRVLACWRVLACAAGLGTVPAGWRDGEVVRW